MTQVLLDVAYLVLIVLFGFQLWRVWRTGHVRWRARKVHRDHRPAAFWFEIAACAVGFLVFAGLLIASLLERWAEGS